MDPAQNRLLQLDLLLNIDYNGGARVSVDVTSLLSRKACLSVQVRLVHSMRIPFNLVDATARRSSHSAALSAICTLEHVVRDRTTHGLSC
jgi:hypothetical protein